MNTLNIDLENLNINLENLTEQERQQFIVLIEKSQKNPVVNLLEPNFNSNDDIVFMSSDGDLIPGKWNGSGFYKDLHKLSKIYLDTPENREMLKKRIEQQKAIVEVNRRVKMIIAEQHPSWVCDFNDATKRKYFPVYDTHSNIVFFSSTWCTQKQFTFEYAPKGVYEQIDENLLKKAMGV